MKNFKARLAGILACLLLFIVPLQADAGWNASPLPAASINTVFGDSTYLNPEWMTKKVTITWNGNTWMTGMDAFKDMPVRLTNNNGAIDCTFLNTAVFQSFFSAINASIASMTTTAAIPVFDNGAGSYIRISGTQHTEAVSSMPDWLAQMLHSLIRTVHRYHAGIKRFPDDTGTGQWNGFHQLRLCSGGHLHDQLPNERSKPQQ